MSKHQIAFVFAGILLGLIVVFPIILINFQTSNILQQQAKFEHSTQTNSTELFHQLSTSQQTLFSLVLVVEIIFVVLFSVTLWYAIKSHKESFLVLGEKTKSA